MEGTGPTDVAPTSPNAQAAAALAPPPVDDLSAEAAPADGEAADTLPSGVPVQPAVEGRLCKECGTALLPLSTRCGKCGWYWNRGRRIAETLFWAASGTAAVIGLITLAFDGWKYVTTTPVLTISEPSVNQLHLRIDGVTGAPVIEQVTIEVDDDYLASNMRLEKPTVVGTTKRERDVLLFNVQFAAVVGSKDFRSRQAEILDAKRSAPVVIRARLSNRAAPLEYRGTINDLYGLISAHISGEDY